MTQPSQPRRFKFGDKWHSPAGPAVLSARPMTIPSFMPRIVMQKRTSSGENR